MQISKRKNNKEKVIEKFLTFAAPPIQYFWADSQGLLITNSPVFESYVVTVSIPRTWPMKEPMKTKQQGEWRTSSYRPGGPKPNDQTTFTYITSMPQFCHCKATFDHIILTVSQPLVMMTLGSKKLDGTTPEIHQWRKHLMISKFLELRSHNNFSL